MGKRLKWAFFGTDLTTSQHDPIAPYYRGILRALSERGHEVVFYCPDPLKHSKFPKRLSLETEQLQFYSNDFEGVSSALEEAAESHILVNFGRLGGFDSELDAAVLDLRRADNFIIYWDLDPTQTLEKAIQNPQDPFRALIPHYDLLITGECNPWITQSYQNLGAKAFSTVYPAFDRTSHFRVSPESRFEGTLGLITHRTLVTESRVEDCFIKAAHKMPLEPFTLGGKGWGSKSLPSNMRYVGPVACEETNAFFSSIQNALFLREKNTQSGCIATTQRLFQAAGLGTCILAESMTGIEGFLEPGEESVMVNHGYEIAELLKSMTTRRVQEIGEAARRKIQSHHRYEHRAEQLENLVRDYWSR